MARNDTHRRAFRRLAALALMLLFAGYGLSIYVATAARAPSPTEAAFARDGFDVQRAAAGPLDALRLDQAGSLVLVDPPALLDAEKDALRAHVESGGALWLVTTRPQDALWPDLARAVHVLPGAVYGADGGAARYQGVERAGMQAIVVDVDATPALRSESSAARDTNGDGVLQAGEPTGPFTVAVRIAVGEGAVVLVAAQPLAAGVDALPYGRLAPDAPPAAVVVDHGPAWARPARAALAMLAAVPAVWWLDALLAFVAVAALLVLLTTSQPVPAASQKPRELIRSLKARVSPAHPFWPSLEEDE